MESTNASSAQRVSGNAIFDLLVVGGGLGGVAAAMTAARLGRRVVLTSEDEWLGGQLTSQAVPPDENRWIESHRQSASYAELRDRIRSHYLENYPLTPVARSAEYLNPGAGFVSRLCHEPRVAALVIEEMLSPLVASGLLTVIRRVRPVEVRSDDHIIRAVTLQDERTGVRRTVEARLVADATELGDLLELADIDHVVGAEARSETHELHAPELADPRDQQAITWCAAVEYRAGENHTIARPAGYARWRSTVPSFWPGPQLSWDDVHPITLERRTRPLFEGTPEEAETTDDRDLWHYRRILSRHALGGGRWPSGDVTLINWPQIDYWDRPLVGVTEAERELALAEARELTLSFVHWMQTEAPRRDGGIGYPELMLRGDVVGSDDGLAREPYIRESRRLRARTVITEAHIGREMRGDMAGSECFADSVGIGFYRIDLHPSTSGRSYVDIDCFPFQLPLGALIPAAGGNLLASAKNIGTTHITNGAYRLHPVEWSIGEAVGALVHHCLNTGEMPANVHASAASTGALQQILSERLGVALAWPADIRTGGDPRPENRAATVFHTPIETKPA